MAQRLDEESQLTKNSGEHSTGRVTFVRLSRLATREPGSGEFPSPSGLTNDTNVNQWLMGGADSARGQDSPETSAPTTPSRRNVLAAQARLPVRRAASSSPGGSLKHLKTSVAAVGLRRAASSSSLRTPRNSFYTPQPSLLQRVFIRIFPSSVMDAENALKSGGGATEDEGAFGCFRPIDPRGEFMARWDVGIALALIFTCVVTPFEVCMLKNPVASSHPLFGINITITIFFAVDIYINFNMIYYDLAHNCWVTSRTAIILRYLGGSALVDIISTIPYDLIALGMPGLHNVSILRVLRILRLTKLLRLAKSSQLLQRFEDSTGMHTGHLTLLKFFLQTLLLTHWLACLLNLVANTEHSPSGCSWHAFYFNNQHGIKFPCDERDTQLTDLYISSLYWAAMTISTVGYGDVTPQTNAERIYITISIFIGASFFSYIVGTVCGVIAKLSTKETELQELMDSCNGLIQTVHLEPELGTRLRAYFRHSVAAALPSIQDYDKILSKLTPALKAEVATRISNVWLSSLVAFADCPVALTMRLSFEFESELYSPGESIQTPGDEVLAIFTVRMGLLVSTTLATSTAFCRLHGIPLTWDNAFRLEGRGGSTLHGEELLWAPPGSTLRSRGHLMSITYLDVEQITPRRLIATIDSFVQTEWWRTVFSRYVTARKVRAALTSFTSAVKRVRMLNSLQRSTPLLLLVESAFPPALPWESAKERDAREKDCMTQALEAVHVALPEDWVAMIKCVILWQRCFRGMRVRRIIDGLKVKSRELGVPMATLLRRLEKQKLAEHPHQQIAVAVARELERRVLDRGQAFPNAQRGSDFAGYFDVSPRNGVSPHQPGSASQYGPLHGLMPSPADGARLDARLAALTASMQRLEASVQQAWVAGIAAGVRQAQQRGPGQNGSGCASCGCCGGCGATSQTTVVLHDTGSNGLVHSQAPAASFGISATGQRAAQGDQQQLALNRL